MEKTEILRVFALISCIVMISSCCGKWFDRYDDYDEKMEYATAVEEPEDSKIRITKTEYKTIKPGEGLTDEKKAQLKVMLWSDGPETDETPAGAEAEEVKGSLSTDVIRRVVKIHHAEVKYCYEKELVKKPDLAGKVVTRFIISGKGKVQSAEIKSSTMNNTGFESCVVKKIKRWVFPPPEGGGIVTVTYPFVMQPSSGE